MAYTGLFYRYGIAVDGDLMFNNHDYAFRVDIDSGSVSNSNCYDLESVALHEAGPLWVLVMWSVLTPLCIPRAVEMPVHILSSHEIAAVCALYPTRGVGSERAQANLCARWAVSVRI